MSEALALYSVEISFRVEVYASDEKDAMRRVDDNIASLAYSEDLWAGGEATHAEYIEGWDDDE